jgi:hypothetical protein
MRLLCRLFGHNVILSARPRANEYLIAALVYTAGLAIWFGAIAAHVLIWS